MEVVNSLVELIVFLLMCIGVVTVLKWARGVDERRNQKGGK